MINNIKKLFNYFCDDLYNFTKKIIFFSIVGFAIFCFYKACTVSSSVIKPIVDPKTPCTIDYLMNGKEQQLIISSQYLHKEDDGKSNCYRFYNTIPNRIGVQLINTIICSENIKIECEEGRK